MFTQRTLIAASLASLLLGAGAATLLRPAEQAHDHAHGAAPAEASDAATQYTCPMHPSVLSDRPGVCPICNMDLVPKKSGAGDALDSQQLAAAGRVSLSAAQRVLANVQTVDARQGTLKRELRAVGLATYDETGLSTVPSWVAGRVDKLYIKETGKRVTRGQRLMTLYSPTLLAAQEELLALSAGDEQERAARAPLLQAARRRLELLGMSKAQIDDVLKRREASSQVHISATSSGTITEIMVRQGQYVEMGMPLLALADLKDIWIEAQIYEHQRAQIKEGMSARVVSSAYPGESFSGRVTLIKPVVASGTRTTPVRVELDGDASKRFKPGMYTTVYLDQSAAEEGVIVPLDAIIRTGRHDYVYVEVEQDLFERREVAVRGVEEGQAQLEAGAIKPGERVAATGGFLIDSELQLRAPLEGVSAPHGHGHDHAHTQEPVTLTPEGTRFNPPIKPEQLPDGAWYCDMGTVEYARSEQGDGECPVCGMKLKHKEGDHKK